MRAAILCLRHPCQILGYRAIEIGLSTDADISSHHNLEEGRKFVIKVDWVQSAASPRHMMCLWLAGEA